MDTDFGLDSSEPLENTRTQRKRRSSLFGKQSNGNANPIPDSDDAFADKSDISAVPPSGSRPRRLATWADDSSDEIQQIRNIQMSANKQKIIARHQMPVSLQTRAMLWRNSIEDSVHVLLFDGKQEKID
ncbi:unnamed protein product [Oppiella nova]|uniref:Uncharacterized protein n=1 Tax=Oppiella nova TaxID=334625 RepID=A0A7R9QF25_9ACAR|nr:unnamed protein product [Oppiella nova]CAG2164541.1 unnamed protein product [Oppiella nova]